MITDKFEGRVCRAEANRGFVDANFSLVEAWRSVVISCSLNSRGCSFRSGRRSFRQLTRIDLISLTGIGVIGYVFSVRAVNLI